jgi:hypothetical protein
VNRSEQIGIFVGKILLREEPRMHTNEYERRKQETTTDGRDGTYGGKMTKDEGMTKSE